MTSAYPAARCEPIIASKHDGEASRGLSNLYEAGSTLYNDTRLEPIVAVARLGAAPCSLMRRAPGGHTNCYVRLL